MKTLKLKKIQIAKLSKTQIKVIIGGSGVYCDFTKDDFDERCDSQNSRVCSPNTAFCGDTGGPIGDVPG